MFLYCSRYILRNTIETRCGRVIDPTDRFPHLSLFSRHFLFCTSTLVHIHDSTISTISPLTPLIITNCYSILIHHHSQYFRLSFVYSSLMYDLMMRDLQGTCTTLLDWVHTLGKCVGGLSTLMTYFPVVYRQVGGWCNEGNSFEGHFYIW